MVKINERKEKYMKEHRKIQVERMKHAWKERKEKQNSTDK